MAVSDKEDRVRTKRLGFLGLKDAVITEGIFVGENGGFGGSLYNLRLGWNEKVSGKKKAYLAKLPLNGMYEDGYDIGHALLFWDKNELDEKLATAVRYKEAAQPLIDRIQAALPKNVREGIDLIAESDDSLTLQIDHGPDDRAGEENCRQAVKRWFGFDGMASAKKLSLEEWEEPLRRAESLKETLERTSDKMHR